MGAGLPVEIGLQILAGQPRLPHVDVHGGTRHVGGYDHVVHGQEGVVGGARLLPHNVHGGACQLALRQRLHHGLLVNDLGSGGVDEQGALLHLGKPRAVDHAHGGGQHRQMHGDDVTLRQNLLQRAVFGAIGGKVLWRAEGVIGQHPHGKACGDPRDPLGHSAEADERDVFFIQLAAQRHGVIHVDALVHPNYVLHVRHGENIRHRLVQRRAVPDLPDGAVQLLAQHQQQGKGVLRHGLGVAPRGVGQRDAQPAAGVRVDVHGVAAGADQQLQSGLLPGAQRFCANVVSLQDDDLAAHTGAADGLLAGPCARGEKLAEGRYLEHFLHACKIRLRDGRA